MALALYRKYRPQSFAELIGQDHVTGPLMQALRTGRLNHAYLFSGPRGCGKTSSARILARSLNCAKGPTPEPCGECESCRGLAPDGAGSIDVIEIDAASHGGVDDARDLRERAFFAPAVSRFKIYIIDEAHMVSSAGFNALLKLVEEPPDYVKFVFATTEPEKVLGTIKSRTHHYPFRLIPPGVLRPYLEQLCEREGVAVEPSVFPLVVRAGGGSARDSLSVLDQLIAGAGDSGVTYAGAVALLGVTDATLIDETCDALAAGDGGAAFSAVDRVAEAGLDPRRFAGDLLERLRDLILLRQVPDAAAKGLIDAPPDQLERMQAHVAHLGPATLSRWADIVHNGLVEMRGTASPRLLLELIVARMLLPGADDTISGLLSRLERLESGALPTSAGATRGAEGSASAPGSASGGGGREAARAAAASAAAARNAPPQSAGQATTAQDSAVPTRNDTGPHTSGPSAGSGPAASAPTGHHAPSVAADPPHAQHQRTPATVAPVQAGQPAPTSSAQAPTAVAEADRPAAPSSAVTGRASGEATIGQPVDDNGWPGVSRPGAPAVGGPDHGGPAAVTPRIASAAPAGPGAGRPAAGPPWSASAASDADRPAAGPSRTASAEPHAVSSPASGSAGGGIEAADVRRSWNEILTLLGRGNKRVAAMARDAVVRDVEGDTLVLVFAHSFHLTSISSDPSALLAAAGEVLGGTWKLRCELGGDQRAASPAESRSAPSRPAPVAQPAPPVSADGWPATAPIGGADAARPEPAKPASRVPRAPARGAKPTGAKSTGVKDDGPLGEPPYDPEFDGPAPSGDYDGFAPGDEPTDEIIDSATARRNSQQQAVDVVKEAFTGAEMIGEVDAR